LGHDAIQATFTPEAVALHTLGRQPHALWPPDHRSGDSPIGQQHVLVSSYQGSRLQGCDSWADYSPLRWMIRRSERRRVWSACWRSPCLLEEHVETALISSTRKHSFVIVKRSLRYLCKESFESSVVYKIVIKQRSKHIQRITYCSIFPTFHLRGWNDEHRKISLLGSF
jgi:hypothetical protein